MKKTISILLIVTMLLSMVLTAIPVGATTGTGSGASAQSTNVTIPTVPTEVNALPVQNWARPWATGTDAEKAEWTALSSVSDLTKVKNGGKFYLTADIEMNVAFGQGNGFDGTPEGTILDGDGHKFIYSSGDYTAFSWASNMEIRNLILTGTLDVGAKVGLAPIGGHNSGGPNGKLIFNNVWSDVDITVNNGGGIAIGGVTMNATDGSSFTDVIFTGSIKRTDGSDVQSVGGIVAQTTGSVSFTRCYVTTASDRVVPSISVTGNVNNVGGLAGIINTGTSFQDCDVNANISVSGAAIPASYSGWFSIGGFVGRTGEATFTNCTTRGTLSYTGNTLHLFVAAFTGIVNGKQTYTNCQSLNDVTVSGNVTGTYCGIGGFTGWSNGALTFTDCTRGGTLNVTMDGWKATNSHGVGGFSGYVSNTTIFDNCKTVVNKTGDGVKFNSKKASDCTLPVGVGGFVGTVDGSTTIKNNSTNNAPVTAQNYVDGIGGFVGYTKVSTTFTSAVNNANLSIDADAEGVGGFIGLNGSSATFTSSTNNGDISVTGAKNIDVAAGGFIGKAQGSSTTPTQDKPNPVLNSYGSLNVSANGDATFTGCKNDSIVSVNITTNKAVMAGGFVGENDGRTLKFNGCSTAKNEGSKVTAQNGKAVYIAGFCPYSWGTVKYNETGSVACVNGATIESTVAAERVGGFAGWQAGGGSLSFNNVRNEGSIIAKGKVNHVGGLVAHINRPITVVNSSNAGSITVEASNNGTWICIGGLIGYSQTDAIDFVNCQNSGDVSFDKADAAIHEAFGIGGMVGLSNQDLTFTGCVNTGDVSALMDTVTLSGVSGYVGWTNAVTEIYSSINDASIYHKGRARYVGGFVGYTDDMVVVSQAVNLDTKNGKGIVAESIDGTEINAGGILGYCAEATVLRELTNVANAAPITATGSGVARAGGIVGIGRSVVENAVNVGKMSGKKAAGIIAEIYGNCEIYNAIDLLAQPIANGSFTTDPEKINISTPYASLAEGSLTKE